MGGGDDDGNKSLPSDLGERGVRERAVGEGLVEGVEGEVVFCDVYGEVGVVMVEHDSREEETTEKKVILQLMLYRRSPLEQEVTTHIWPLLPSSMSDLNTIIDPPFHSEYSKRLSCLSLVYSQQEPAMRLPPSIYPHLGDHPRPRHHFFPRHASASFG